jgi:hypothetical protein
MMMGRIMANARPRGSQDGAMGICSMIPAVSIVKTRTRIRAGMERR